MINKVKFKITIKIQVVDSIRFLNFPIYKYFETGSDDEKGAHIQIQFPLVFSYIYPSVKTHSYDFLKLNWLFCIGIRVYQKRKSQEIGIIEKNMPFKSLTCTYMQTKFHRNDSPPHYLIEIKMVV